MANPKSTDTPGEDGEHVDPFTGEITEDVAAGMILEAFQSGGGALIESDTPEAIQKRIVDRIFAAESMDELFGQWEMLASDQLEGRTFTIDGCEFDIYTPNDGGSPVPLAKVKAREDGKVVQFITTAPNLTTFIARAIQLDGLPFTATIVGSKTRRGFTALHFARA